MWGFLSDINDEDVTMIERESGFYWVRVDCDWFIAEWVHHYAEWHIAGGSVPFCNDDLMEIDETPIVRGDCNA